MTKHLDQSLTERQTEIIRLTAQGLKMREIAKRLCIETASVNSHLALIAAKLGTRDRALLTVYAVQHRIIEVEVAHD